MSAGPASPARPNILLISTDQQSASAMSCAGNADVDTPAVDALAADGVRFARAYCTYPLCAPARSSYITGHLPHATGVVDNGQPMREELREQTVGRRLGEAGYRCALAGKWHVPGLTPEEGGLEVLCGTRDALIPEVAGEYFRASDERPFLLFASFTNPHDVCQLARSQSLPQGPVASPPSLAACPNLPANFEAPAYGPEMLDLVQRHNPRVYSAAEFAPDDWRRLRYGYFRIVEKLDAEIGRLLTALRDAGHEQDTLVLFTSDHGDGHGAHRWNQKSALWEEVIRIPFIARGPGVAGGRVVEHLVSNGLDLLPTICEAAGVAISAGLPGRPLQPLLAGDAPDDWRRELVVETAFGLGEGPGGRAQGRALVGERHKYSVYTLGRGREQLVDLATDPGEMTNLAVEERWQDELQAHRERLQTHCSETGDEIGRLIP